MKRMNMKRKTASPHPPPLFLWSLTLNLQHKQTEPRPSSICIHRFQKEGSADWSGVERDTKRAETWEERASDPDKWKGLRGGGRETRRAGVLFIQLPLHWSWRRKTETRRIIFSFLYSSVHSTSSETSAPQNGSDMRVVEPQTTILIVH